MKGPIIIGLECDGRIEYRNIDPLLAPMSEFKGRPRKLEYTSIAANVQCQEHWDIALQRSGPMSKFKGDIKAKNHLKQG